MNNFYENRQLNYFIDSDDDEGCVRGQHFDTTSYYIQHTCSQDLNDLTNINILENNFTDLDCSVLQVPYNGKIVLNNTDPLKEIVVYGIDNLSDLNLALTARTGTNSTFSISIIPGKFCRVHGRVIKSIVACKSFEISPVSDSLSCVIYYRYEDRRCTQENPDEICSYSPVQSINKKKRRIEDANPNPVYKLYSIDDEPSIVFPTELHELEYDVSSSVMLFRGSNLVDFDNLYGSVDYRVDDVLGLRPLDSAIVQKTVYNLTFEPLVSSQLDIQVFYGTSNYLHSTKVVEGNIYIFSLYFSSARYLFITVPYDTPITISYNNTDKTVKCPSRPAKFSSCFSDLSGVKATRHRVPSLPKYLLRSISPHTLPYDPEHPVRIFDSGGYSTSLSGGYDDVVQISRFWAAPSYGCEYENYYTNQRTVNCIYFYYSVNLDSRNASDLSTYNMSIEVNFTISKYSDNNDPMHEEIKTFNATWDRDNWSFTNSFNLITISRPFRSLMSNVKKVHIKVSQQGNQVIYVRGIFVDNVDSTCTRLADPEILPQCTVISESATIKFDEGVHALDSIGIAEFSTLPRTKPV